MVNYLSTNPGTISFGGGLRSRMFFDVSDSFDDEGECPEDECGYAGEMEFVIKGFETAEAECPQCRTTVEKYIGVDV